LPAGVCQRGSDALNFTPLATKNPLKFFNQTEHSMHWGYEKKFEKMLVFFESALFLIGLSSKQRMRI
jgi:hypothetical protein